MNRQSSSGQAGPRRAQQERGDDMHGGLIVHGSVGALLGTIIGIVLQRAPVTPTDPDGLAIVMLAGMGAAFGVILAVWRYVRRSVSMK